MRKIIVLLLVSIFLISACAQQKPAETSEDLIGQGTPVQQQMPSGNSQVEEKIVGEEATSATQAPTQTPQSAEVREFRMTAKQFQFEPSTIEVNKGDRIRLLVTSMDVPHGISIPEYGINERLDPGKEVTIEFTADKQGTFTAFCSVFCGSGHSSMKGKIVVK
ncbi:cupredoxin domain-containing protein [Candidatus Woesearchaeota archaeon]|nr:cupredoxin domain-containing protein [Candidatus Woesearchaeota archaeon]